MNCPQLRRFLVNALLPVTVLGIGISFAQTLNVNLGNYAEIGIPSDASLQKAPEQMPDFSVYYVTRMQKTLLGIYFGNSPAVDQKKLTVGFKVGGCLGSIFEENTSNGKNYDVVLQIKGVTFPQYVHFFARGLSGTEVSEVNEIWRTFRLLGDRSC